MLSITNPTQLVDEFKKSGEFDRLRRELLSQFQQCDGISTFKARIEDIARQRLASDKKLRYLPPEAVYKELMQNMDRFPVVERAAADVEMLSDPIFSANIHKSAQRILRDGRGNKSQSQTPLRKDKESDVNQARGASMQASVIHSLKSSNPAPQGASSRPSTKDFALQSPNVTLDTNTNTPPPTMLRENSQIPESRKMDISGIPEQSKPSQTVLTEPDLTTAGGAPLVDVEMADGSQPDGVAKAPT